MPPVTTCKLNIASSNSLTDSTHSCIVVFICVIKLETKFCPNFLKAFVAACETLSKPLVKVNVVEAANHQC